METAKLIPMRLALVSVAAVTVLNTLGGSVSSIFSEIDADL